MATLTRRKDRKGWVVDWREGGVRQRKTFTDRQRAKEFLRIKEDHLERMRTKLPHQHTATFGEFAELFLTNHFKQCTDRYRKEGENIFRHTIIPFFTDRLVQEKGCAIPLLALVEPHDIQAYLDFRKSQGRAPKTIYNEYRWLGLLFRKAIDNQFVTEDPTKWVKPPTPVPLRERGVVPDEEFETLLRQCDDEVRKGLIIIANTGLRLSEFFSLKRENFDVAAGVLYLRSTTSFTTKNKKSRTIPISDAVINLVLAVPAAESIMQITEDAFSDRVRRLKEKLGFVWTVHELRHTYVSKQLKAGVDRRTLREWTGHKTDSMIDKYGHFIPDAIEPVRNNINIGAQFTTPLPANVVTKWSPRKSEKEKTLAKSKSSEGSSAPRTGLEPVTR